MKTHSTLDLQDTIVALSSALGPGARAIVRITGKRAWDVARACFQGQEPCPQRIQRGRWHGMIELRDVTAPLPAELLVWPAPRTYTGQDLVEIHTLSSPPLVDALIAHLLRLGARPAEAGEFTLRAFLAGKLDLTQAEAVLAVIEASTNDELKTALEQLAGGMSRPLQVLREDLLGLLAEVEAGLDFTEEDLSFISREELSRRLDKARQSLEELQSQMEKRGLSGRAFRVVLTGRANAGKSSLFNALAGQALALVSPEPGTTRDYLIQRASIDGMDIELIDTAGGEASNTPSQPSPDSGEGRVGVCSSPERDITLQAQEARRQQLAQADLLLVCLDATQAVSAEELRMLSVGNSVPARGVWTKCDLLESDAALPIDLLRTSAVNGQGLATVWSLVAECARQARRPSSLAPSLSRCRHHLEAALDHVQQATAIVEHQEPPELLALELRLALEQIGEMVGAIYTEDLLDRIFSQFCIGK